MVKMEEIQGLSVDELIEKYGKMKKELMQFRFQAETGKLERQTAIRDLRRDIARVLTVMNQKKKEEKA